MGTGLIGRIDAAPAWATPVVLIGPALLLVVAVFGYPVAELIVSAFGEGHGLDAFRTIVGSSSYRSVYLNTILISLIVTALCLVLGFPVAFTMHKLRGVAGTGVLYLVLFPFWISLLVRTYSWLLLLPRSGPVNNGLMALGVVDLPVSLLYTNTAVVIGMTHVLLPYAILPIYARMRSIDPSLLRASEGLGAHPLRTFWSVYLPLLAPGLIGAAAVVFVLGLGFFVTPMILGGARSMMISTLIHDLVVERSAWGLAAAASIVLMVLAAGVLLAFRRFFGAVSLSGGAIR